VGHVCFALGPSVELPRWKTRRKRGRSVLCLVSYVRGGLIRRILTAIQPTITPIPFSANPQITMSPTPSVPRVRCMLLKSLCKQLTKIISRVGEIDGIVQADASG